MLMSGYFKILATIAYSISETEDFFSFSCFPARNDDRGSGVTQLIRQTWGLTSGLVLSKREESMSGLLMAMEVKPIISHLLLSNEHINKYNIIFVIINSITRFLLLLNHFDLVP